MDTQIDDGSGSSVYKTAKVVLFRIDPNGGLPWVLFVYTVKCKYRDAGWYLPGGGEELEDKGSYAKTAQRELFEETGYSVPLTMFLEERMIQARPFRSDDKKYTSVSIRYYFVLWHGDMESRVFSATDEIVKVQWFRLDSIPRSSRAHLRQLHTFLRSLKGTVQGVQEWLYAFETSMQYARIARPLYLPLPFEK
jgi:8-oxo-dGTP pyrophosphatase MutT (NUDIX family)